MKNVISRPSLGRCLLGGLFTGMITAVLVLIFNYIYRKDTQLDAQLYIYVIIMPFSIFLFFPLLHMVTGMIYYLFVNHLRNGRIIFSILFLFITLVGACAIAYSGSAIPEPEIGVVRGLFVGIGLITGLMGVFFIPFFAAHSRIFLTDEKAG